MLEEAVIAKELDVEAANERLTTLKAELAALEGKSSGEDADVWIERARESRELLLAQNHRLVELEKKCARQEGEVVQAQLVKSLPPEPALTNEIIKNRAS